MWAREAADAPAPAAAPATEEDVSPEETAEVVSRLQQALFKALPSYAMEQLTELLEFIATQHPGSNFNPDNTSKAIEICAFCKKTPFPVSAAGVSALARLARHCLGSSDGDSKSVEHQMWLLTGTALNTAAAVRDFDGDPLALFEAVRTDGGVRGRYMQRLFAKAAMEAHLRSPDDYRDGVPPPDVRAALMRQLKEFGPLQIVLSSLVLFVAVVAGLFFINDRAHDTIVDLTAPASTPNVLERVPTPTPSPAAYVAPTPTMMPTPTLTEYAAE